jgi:hypothetical protein
MLCANDLDAVSREVLEPFSLVDCGFRLLSILRMVHAVVRSRHILRNHCTAFLRSELIIFLGCISGVHIIINVSRKPH